MSELFDRWFAGLGGTPPRPTPPSEKEWHLYMAVCADGTLYVGISTDPARRMQEHNGRIPGKGAAYTKARRPVVLVHDEPLGTHRKGEAEQYERQVKRLTRKQKMALVANAQRAAWGYGP